MFYIFSIGYKGVTEQITVYGHTYGKDWAETRAISNFMFRHKQLEHPGVFDRVMSFKELADFYRKDGLVAELVSETKG